MNDTTDKKRIIENIRKRIEDSKETYIADDYRNALSLISQVIFTKSSGFLLELIQNAEDSGLRMKNDGVFEICANKRRIRVNHNGCLFNETDVRALCGIRSSKKPERGTLGYLGIGFKSVFKVTDAPEIYSNGFHFKFDRDAWKDPDTVPWQVLPIWIDTPSESIDPARTTMLIPFRDDSLHDSFLAELKELGTQLYLFLRWLKRIEIKDEVSGKTWYLANLGELEKDMTTLERDGRKQRFRIFRRAAVVPDNVKADRLTRQYRANVTQREIAIAFALDQDNNLAPMEAGAMYGGVYSFLPLGEAKSGAKFPIQADFLVVPGRDAINYEARWNHWLVQEVANLCKDAVECFKNHEKWRYQFLPAFAFVKSEGLEAYEKLFGPKLIIPIEAHLENDHCVLTIDGGWVKPRQAVRLKESKEAREALISFGLFQAEEIAPSLGGEADLRLAHPRFREGSLPIKEVDRWTLLNDSELLERKSQGPDAAAWFTALYLWLHKHPSYEDYFHYKLRKRLRNYHQFEFVLTAEATLFTGGKVFLPDLPALDPVVKDVAHELQASKPLLHPDILGNAANDEERSSIRKFLTGLTGVQPLSPEVICREAVLPKILTTAPKPPSDTLVNYTRYCQNNLGSGAREDFELWVLTKRGDIRSAKEVLLSGEFKPEENWEVHQQYISGANFLSGEYVQNITNDAELKAWREFFRSAGIKNAPNSGVEEFAMKYAESRLRTIHKTVTPVENRNFGYDIEVESHSGDRLHIEVKGQTSERDEELSRHETEIADRYKDSYYLCIVTNIPENPSAYLIRNPMAVGRKEKLTVPAAAWKKCPWP